MTLIWRVVGLLGFLLPVGMLYGLAWLERD